MSKSKRANARDAAARTQAQQQRARDDQVFATYPTSEGVVDFEMPHIPGSLDPTLDSPFSIRQAQSQHAGPVNLKCLRNAPFFQNGLQAKSGLEMCFDIGSRHLACWGQSRIKKFTPHCVCRPSHAGVHMRIARYIIQRFAERGIGFQKVMKDLSTLFKVRRLCRYFLFGWQSVSCFGCATKHIAIILIIICA